MTILPLKRLDRRAVILLAGDTLALVLFAVLGRGSHGQATGLAAIGETLRTAAPFVVGWLATAPLLGALNPQTARGLAPMLRATALTWPAALLVGAIIRAAIIGRFSPPSFYVVTFLVGLLLLGLWRAAFVLVEGRR
jgi:Protein of unknown function (DUF3054)